jgi:hypothetical protein
MGSFFGKVVEGWVGIVGGKLLYVIGGAKFLRVINVDSWCLSCRRSKTLLSHLTTCAMV